MRKESSIYEAIITPVGLSFVLILTTFLFVGCISNNYREDPKLIYHAYAGTQLPQEDVATVWWYKGRGIVVNINGRDLYTCEDPYNCSDARVHYIGAELLPGVHKLEFQLRGYKAVPAVIMIEAELVAGHSYSFQTTAPTHAQHPSDYTVALIDDESGELIAGRPPEASRRSLEEITRVVENMQLNSATEKEVIEQLSVPYDRISENILVYNRLPLPAPGKERFLFLEFGATGTLKSFTNIDVPLHRCKRSMRWDYESAWEEYNSCKYSFEKCMYAEYYAMHNNPIAAYKLIENGLQVRSKMSNDRRETLSQDIQMLLSMYPEILRAAKSTFTKAAFDISYQEFGEYSEDIERKRLAIYRQLADPEDYEEAETRFSTYFGNYVQQ